MIQTEVGASVKRSSLARRGAVVLLSGGIDSAVCAWMARGEQDRLNALTFKYGQTHSREVYSALRLGEELDVERHLVLDLPLSKIGGSALFELAQIPSELAEGVSPTWVPQRNTIFLAFAAAWAEVLGLTDVYIGVNYIDYSGYPDCRPEFLMNIQFPLNLASKRFIEGGPALKVCAPVITLTKREIIQKGLELKVPFQHTWSCYRGGAKACGKCPSCLIRLKGFQELGIRDPLEYEQ